MALGVTSCRPEDHYRTRNSHGGVFSAGIDVLRRAWRKITTTTSLSTRVAPFVASSQTQVHEDTAVMSSLGRPASIDVYSHGKRESVSPRTY
jgi:hypothetical protein